jgi:hypothetical protein
MIRDVPFLSTDVSQTQTCPRSLCPFAKAGLLTSPPLQRPSRSKKEQWQKNAERVPLWHRQEAGSQRRVHPRISQGSLLGYMEHLGVIYMSN